MAIGSPDSIEDAKEDEMRGSGGGRRRRPEMQRKRNRQGRVGEAGAGAGCRRGAAAILEAGRVAPGGDGSLARSSGQGRGEAGPRTPGRPPTWCFSTKDGVGTALAADSSPKSLVWFTLGRGILTEVYHPRVDQACIRDLGLVDHRRERFLLVESATTPSIGSSTRRRAFPSIG